MKPKQRKTKRRGLKNSFRYFRNTDCKYFPCHKVNPDEFNCLFCFCPVYFAICPGTPEYIEKDGTVYKNCADCEYPHIPENYDAVVECISLLLNGEQND
jgi:Zn-finger protein